MLEAFATVILGVCLSSFRWELPELDKCRDELLAYERQLEQYESDVVNFEHRVYEAAEYKKLLAQREVDQSLKDSRLIDKVMLLLKDANDERERYEEIHMHAGIVKSDVRNMRECLNVLLHKLNDLRSTAEQGPFSTSEEFFDFLDEVNMNRE